MNKELSSFSLLRLFTAGVFFLLGGGGLISCGVKGPPEPPLLPRPAAPEKFRARVREGCVELAWNAPTLKGKADVPAVQWEILRAPEPEPGLLPPFVALERVPDTAYRDCHPLPGRSSYLVAGISAELRRGVPSNPVQVMNLPPPPAPENLRAEVGDQYIVLSWFSPPAVSLPLHFNVYRSSDPHAFPWRPLNPQPLSGNTFMDGPFINNMTVYYEVRSVLLPEKALPVEGPAAALQATPGDKIPPSPPQGLMVIWTDEGVLLRWLHNPEPDLKGYLVYRKSAGTAEFVPLFSEPLPEPAYLDRTAKKGVEYEYLVRAVDTAQPPNLSAPSEIQKAYAEP